MLSWLFYDQWWIAKNALKKIYDIKFLDSTVIYIGYKSSVITHNITVKKKCNYSLKYKDFTITENLIESKFKISSYDNW